MPLKGIDLPGEPQEIPKEIPTQAGMDGSGGAGMMPSESIGETSESIGDLPSESLGDMTSESLGVPHAGKIHQDMTSESLGEKRPPGAPPLEMALRVPSGAPAHAARVPNGALAAPLWMRMYRSRPPRSYRPQEYLPRIHHHHHHQMNLDRLNRTGPPRRDMRTPIIHRTNRMAAGLWDRQPCTQPVGRHHQHLIRHHREQPHWRWPTPHVHHKHLLQTQFQQLPRRWPH